MVCADCGLGINEVKNIQFYWNYEGDATNVIINICKDCYDKYIDKEDLYDFIGNRILSLTGERVEPLPQEDFVC